MSVNKQKTILFFPLNSAGHINSSIAIANVMKEVHGYKTVFLILGEMYGNSVVEHGHEMVQLEEANPLEDYEIEPGEDPHHLDEEKKVREGKKKRIFAGAYKLPQLLRRFKKVTSDSRLDELLDHRPEAEKFLLRDQIDNRERCAEVINTIKPDLIICDSVIVPACVVKCENTPWVRLWSANPLSLVKSKLEGDVGPLAMVGERIYNKTVREKMRLEEPEKWAALLEHWKDWSRQLDQVMNTSNLELKKEFAKLGLPPLKYGLQHANSPYLNIYMFPESLDYDQDDDIFEYPSRVLRFNALKEVKSDMLNDSKVKFWSDKLEKARVGKSAVIFFSLGSLASGNADRMKRYVDMFRKDQNRLYVVSKGLNGEQYELDENNMIGDNYLPQIFFLQHCDLAIIHGGNNSLTECVFYGVPMIILPVFGDQLDNAQRVEDLGFGRQLNINNCTQQEMFQAIDEILSNIEMRNNIRELGKEMRLKNDFKKVTYVLDKLAKEGNLSEEAIREYNMKSYHDLIAPVDNAS